MENSEFRNNRHYLRVNETGTIIGGWSDGPLPDKDITDAICIREDGGYQFRLNPNGEENPALYNSEGIPLYKWVIVDGVQTVQTRTPEEIAAELAAMPVVQPEPTISQRMDATEAALLALMEV